MVNLLDLVQLGVNSPTDVMLSGAKHLGTEVRPFASLKGDIPWRDFRHPVLVFGHGLGYSVVHRDVLFRRNTNFPFQIRPRPFWKQLGRNNAQKAFLPLCRGGMDTGVTGFNQHPLCNLINVPSYCHWSVSSDYR